MTVIKVIITRTISNVKKSTTGQTLHDVVLFYFRLRSDHYGNPTKERLGNVLKTIQEVCGQVVFLSGTIRF